MSKVNLLKLDGTPNGTIDVPAVFSVEPKKELLHQAVVTFLANSRQSNAHTKTRGEVSGGGRKPWKQKGTGRARAGSSRSPIWIGGGITFGPRSDANHSLKMPTKMKHLALAMALSTKIEAKKLIIAEGITVSDAKTKQAAQLIKNMAPEAKTVLLVTATIDPAVLQAIRNIPTVAAIKASDLSTFDVLSFDQIIVAKDAIEVIEKQLADVKAKV